MKQKQYLTPEFINQLTADSKLNVENLIILTCAIFIASIGLNMNSTAAIIGAMLISPLMSPLLAIGTGLAIYDTHLIRNGVSTIIMEVVISLIASTTYFYFSPLSYASQEILGRTSPTIWDVMIAFFGGTAGIIGASKMKATNIVPGVAIATALMPPLCTVGYSIASGNLNYFLGSGYLFLINVIFIILTAFLGAKIMNWLNEPGQKHPGILHLPTYKEVLFVAGLLLLLIPSVLSAKQMVQQSIAQNNVHQLITNEFKDTPIIKEDINEQTKTINLTISGSKANMKKIKRVKQRLQDYHLSGYSLNVIQVAQLNASTEAQIDNRITSIITQQQQAEKKKHEQQLQKQSKQNKKIAKLSHDINSVTAVSSSNTKKNSIIIELNKSLSHDQKEALIVKIKDKYPNIDKVDFVLKDK